MKKKPKIADLSPMLRCCSKCEQNFEAEESHHHMCADCYEGSEESQRYDDSPWDDDHLWNKD